VVLWSPVSADDLPPVQSPPADPVTISLSGYLSGFVPVDQGLSVGGSRVPHTDLRSMAGAGIKFEAYPAFTRHMVGGEIEGFVSGGSIKAPPMMSASGLSQAQGTLITLTTMYNLMLRYPGRILQPYLGAGAGLSTGILYNVNMTSSNATAGGSSRDSSFAYQFLGGLRAFVTTNLFVFGEYKYFVTTYRWEQVGAGDVAVNLDFHTHIVSGGIGWSF
jgi:opacity protein-like surface antigen